MKRIWKYQLEQTDEQDITLPEGAKILTVAVQKGWPCMWAEVDSDNAPETIKILTFGTNEAFYSTEEMQYIGSYQLYNGSFVGHVYVVKS